MGVSSISYGPLGVVEVAYAPLIVAELSYDVVATLEPTRRGTDRIPVTFDQGVVIVGFFPSVRPRDWGSFSASGQLPTAEDILVDWDLQGRTHLTANESLEPNVGGDAATGFCTLAALGLESRLIQKALPVQGQAAAPQCGFIFRWRGPYNGAGQAPGAVSIRLTVLAEPLRAPKE